jgi:hypothetical protein
MQAKVVKRHDPSLLPKSRFYFSTRPLHSRDIAMHIILVALLLVSVGWDVAAAKPSEGMIQLAFSEVWLNGTREWLRACRVTQSDRVAYAERTHQFVDQEPDLYTQNQHLIALRRNIRLLYGLWPT